MRSMFSAMAFVLMIPLIAFTQQSEDDSPRDAATHAKASATDPLVETRLALRDLWRTHIFWVRAAVVATHDDNATARKVAETQAVANAKAIAASVEPFYGEEGREQLFDLLAGHWGAIEAYLMAKDNENQADGTKAEKELYANAEQIAEFLSSANPNWPKKAMLTMLNTHAGLHIRQINQIYAEAYEQEAETWSAFVENVTTMADGLALGLAKQFPDQFRSQTAKKRGEAVRK